MLAEPRAENADGLREAAADDVGERSSAEDSEEIDLDEREVTVGEAAAS